jgi:hypothetical protein
MASVALVLIAGFALRASLVYDGFRRMFDRSTVEERVELFGAAARARLATHFGAAAVAYPPERFDLVGLKTERELRLYAPDADGTRRHVRTWPFTAASGVLGPKLREGDKQVPEGIYAIESLNPNSSYHLSLRLDYPNAFDRERGREDGRRHLGSDIMIHGRAASVGCIAVGDEAVEELFVLAADAGFADARVLISPFDFRAAPSAALPREPAWVSELYSRLRDELDAFPRPAP